MTMPDLFFVDLSHHNTVSDFTKVKAAGLLGIVHKATEGIGFVDSKYASREKSATAAGLAWASYHFLKHGNIASQIDHYLTTIKPEPGARVVIDYEDAACTLDDLRAAIRRIEQSDASLQITVYAGHLLKEQLGGKNDPVLARTSLWIAQYNNTGPSWPSGTWPTWTAWQFTDKATIAGINPPTDGNQFNGSRENCLKWFGPASASARTAQPEPAFDPAGVTISIDARPGTPVAIVVNGRQATAVEAG
ncbi:MAG: glycoside hydrolase family 25 protein [Mesorhizobium sp.]